MLLIRSIKTGLETKVTPEQWEGMLNRGDNRKFTIVKRDVEKAEEPEDLSGKAMEATLKRAAAFERKKKFNEALGEYKSISADDRTDFINDKIAKLQAKLAEKDEE